MTSKLDQNGEIVGTFARAIPNLAEIGRLTDLISDIADSEAWRDYRDGSGRFSWREAEFDYFLISENVPFEDVWSVLQYNERGTTLAPRMDRSADGQRRRSLAEASHDWITPFDETLAARAERLGWLGKSGRIKSALPGRARVRAQYGTTREQHERQTRTQRIPIKRRRILDRLATDLLHQLESADERRYVVDQLRQSKTGRPWTPAKTLEAWQQDAERMEWKVSALTEHWGVTRQQAHRRINELRARM